MENILIV